MSNPTHGFPAHSPTFARTPASAGDSVNGRWRLVAGVLLVAAMLAAPSLARTGELPCAAEGPVGSIDDGGPAPTDPPSPTPASELNPANPSESIAAPASNDMPEAVDPSAAPFRPCDILADVWVISTRSTRCACCCPESTDRIRYARRQGCRWVASDLDQFLATAQPWRPVVIWMHGNNTTDEEARTSGWQVYRLIARGRAEPIRFVIWSWPSDRDDFRIVRDLRFKASVSDAQGHYLAWFLDQLPPELPVILIGYSYGTRVISSGLNVLGREMFHGDPRPFQPIAMGAAARTLLIAAAQDSFCFSGRGQYAFAPSQMLELKILFNPHDPVLHWYPRLNRPGGPPALGATGLIQPHRLPFPPTYIRQENVSPLVGLHHALDNYLESPAIVARLRQFVYAPFVHSPPHAESRPATTSMRQTSTTSGPSSYSLRRK